MKPHQKCQMRFADGVALWLVHSAYPSSIQYKSAVLGKRRALLQTNKNVPRVGLGWRGALHFSRDQLATVEAVQ
jgi:hypothetical protein